LLVKFEESEIEQIRDQAARKGHILDLRS